MLLKTAIAGLAAGAVNGLFGAGGGMVLIPLLTLLTDLKEDEVFPASVSIIAPICIISLIMSTPPSGLPWMEASPYLIGSMIGGVFVGILSGRIPVKWLHRILGLLILWGGWRYLC